MFGGTLFRFICRKAAFILRTLNLKQPCKKVYRILYCNLLVIRYVQKRFAMFYQTENSVS